MKYKILWLLLLALFLGGCEESPGDLSTATPTAWTTQRDGYFQVEVPDWPEADPEDPETILFLTQEGFFAVVNRYPSLPEIFSEEFKKFIEREQEAYLVVEDTFQGQPFFEFTTRSNNQTTRLQAVLQYCQGYTYAVVVGGPESVSMTPLYEHVLASASCQDPVQVPDLQTGKIGMIVNPQEDDILNYYQPGLRLAKENGVQVVHTYLDWETIEESPGEYNWDFQDYLMGYRIEEGFEISAAVNVIHTAVRGPVPEDLQGLPFDDPEFIDRFTSFILALLDRYPLQYLSIGNEVNDYFVNHREEIPAYQTFFDAVYQAVKKQHPDVQVAMTFAYHDAEAMDALDIIEQLDRGDFLPLTFYLYGPGFVFDRDPQALEGYLERMLELADGKPLAVVEIGWNTAESLQGNQEDQAEFVREAFRLLAENREQIEFLCWFSLHDRDLENSYQAALSFIPHRPDLVEDEEFMAMFVDFLNYLGLREADGAPKQAWYAFQEEAERYLSGQP